MVRRGRYLPLLPKTSKFLLSSSSYSVTSKDKTEQKKSTESDMSQEEKTNQTIYDLLTELNQNGARVNEFSKKKSQLLKQLESEMDQINELSTIPVLCKYFELLFHLETCQLKIEQHQLEKSDIATEMYMTQQIILNMMQMKHGKGVKLVRKNSRNGKHNNKRPLFRNSHRVLLNSKSNDSFYSTAPLSSEKSVVEPPPKSQLVLVNLIKKHMEKFKQHKQENKTDGSESSALMKSLVTYVLKTSAKTPKSSPSKNKRSIKTSIKFKKHRNCSLQCKHVKNSSPVNEEEHDEQDEHEQCNDESNDDFDPYIETIERLKSKLSFLKKHKQMNENTIRELSGDYHKFKQQLKRFYQDNYQEMLSNQQVLDEYFQYRVRAQEIQAKVNQTESMIREYRNKYRQTMDKIRILSNNIHQSRQDLRKQATTEN